MDSIPKLLPTWHDIALQDYIRKKCVPVFRTVYPPTHGGIGVDVDDESSSCGRKEMNVAGSCCALPFMPLKKIPSLEDPCLEALKREKFEFDKFCMKLTRFRIMTNKKKFLENLKDLKNQLNRCQENETDSIDIKVQKNLVYLAEKKPKKFVIPKCNTAYAGGALAVLKSSNNLQLLHPVFGDLNKLCVTSLQNSSSQHFQPDLCEQFNIDLEKELILQIEPSTNDFCCVRQKNSFHLVNVTNMTIFSKRIHKSSLYHVAVSPYNPMEILSIYEKGMIKLLNIETRKTWSISENLDDDLSLLYPTWRCGFGSHLFSVLCMNEKSVYSFDCRERIYSKKKLFSIENPSCHIGEELVAMKLWSKNPFQHLLTSSHHLIICDERYPKKPVMYWNHTLKDPPIYLECTNLKSSESCIVIGSQGTQELAAFLFSHDTNIQPVSLTSPLLLSSPTDCLESLKLHAFYINDKLSSRLSSPLSGLSIIPKDNEIAFTVVQSTSLGDIFYQDFSQSETTEKSHHVSTGCVLTPPHKILPHLEERIASSSDSDEATEDMEEDVMHFQINIEKLLTPPKEISSNCSLCRSRCSSDTKELVLSEICPRCRLNAAESQHFSKAEANLAPVIGPTSENLSFLDCDMEYLSGFKDTYSKRILSVWLESDHLEDSQAFYDESAASRELFDMTF